MFYKIIEKENKINHIYEVGTFVNVEVRIKINLYVLYTQGVLNELVQQII